MNFRTLIQYPTISQRINYAEKLFFIGSCFAENIGNRLSELKFDIVANPFGVAYNPRSITAIIDIILGRKTLDDSFIVDIDKRYYSLMHTTKVSGASKEELQSKAAKITEDSYDLLTQCSRLFITFGTSWIYQYNESSKVVNNCLKLPAKCFTRQRVTVEDIVRDFDELYSKYPELENKKIYLTVSPIRHLKDGLIENSLSKAILIVACHQLIEKHKNIEYIPAFETLNDDLRDYRFYKEDMVHPNSSALNYIMKMFQESMLDSKSQEFCRDNQTVINAMKHKIVGVNKEKNNEFCENSLKKIATFERRYTDVSYTEEKDYFKTLY